MANKVSTKHLIVDIKTGYAYGIKLDNEGKCTAVQPLNTIIESLSGDTVVNKFGPLVDAVNPTKAKDIPYGKTIYAVEMGLGDKSGKMFTVAFPSEADIKAGIMPSVATKEMPEDLARAGLAAAVKIKGQGVDNAVALKKALENIDNMIGLDTAKRDIKQNIAVARFNKAKQDAGLSTKPISRHMVFTGNPGTGKTTFAREVAKVYHALGFIDKPEVTEVKREDLVAGYVGQTALKTKEVIDKAKGGILFIDEAYALSRGGEGGGAKDFGAEAIDTLVAAMENMREDLIVIVAGYPEPMKRFIDANEGLKSRFMTYIGFDNYDLKQLGEIMDFMLVERGYVMTPDAHDHAMRLLEAETSRAAKDFGNGRTVRNLVEKAEKELAMRLENDNMLTENHGMTMESWKAALTTLTLDDVRGISLDGLGESVSLKIGFGESAARPKAENDNAGARAPIVQEKPVSKKKAGGIDFGK
jgi:AAA+ superfamily predicted ATPase